MNSHVGSNLDELYFDVLRSSHRARGGELVLEVDDVLSESLRLSMSSSDGNSDSFEVEEVSLLGLEVVEVLDGLKEGRTEGQSTRRAVSFPS